MKNRGFTLIELLVVVVLLTLFASLLALSGPQITSSADAVAIVNNLAKIRADVILWYIDHQHLIDYTSYRRSKSSGIVKKNASDRVGPLQNKIGKNPEGGNNDDIGIRKYTTVNINPQGGESSKEGEYIVFDCGSDRATWFVGYTFTKLEKKTILPKLKANAKSLGLHFAWPYPNSKNDEGTVWMKIMGNWSPE